MLLDGKVAIVTGAARGTGKAIARRFVAEGAAVAQADVLVEQGEATAAKLGPAASFHELDVTDAEGWAALVEGVVAEHGHVDVLVNNAAILHLGSIEATGLDTFRRVFDVKAVCPAGGNPAMYGPWAAELADIGPAIGAYMEKRAIPREATTDEIASVALFLASDLSTMVTGADVPIDGGHPAGDHVAGFGVSG
jgi:NAD(P)-dependent dehydrogenase (short-subunit alcohol dehydrogenase family)